jgi:putative ABC transport system permease protein
MFKNLIKISFRNIKKEKGYSFINILGLIIGITSCLFLVLYIIDELSYDNFHVEGEHVYRVVTNITEVDNEFTWAVAQTPFAPTVKKNYPEVEKYARLTGTGRMMFKKGGENMYEEDFFYADSATFELFTFKFIQGDPETCLYEPNSIVITEDIAIKYFDKTDVVGETLIAENLSLKVTGVIENIPKNTHISSIQAFISWSTLQDFRREGNWGNFGVRTYIYCPNLTDPVVFQEKLHEVYDNYCAEIFADMGIDFNYILQNIQDIHLHSKIGDEAESGGDIAYVYIFSAVAFFILLIASINYMNLSTARSMKRAREVGIRKVMGSHRRQIIVQFLTESMIYTLISLLISVILVLALIPFYNDLMDKAISPVILLNPVILISLVGIVVFVAILSGSYPSFFLSSFKPVEVLKINSGSKGGSSIVRKFLVILQFGISVTMIISTWIVYDQLNYIREKDLGFDKDRIIRIVMFNQEMRDKFEVLRNELKKSNSIVEVGSATSSPGYGFGKNLINVENDAGEMVERGIDLYGIDYDYIHTLGFEILEGRNFSREVTSDTSQAVVVTESMAKRMNWDNAIGKKFQFGTGEEDPFMEVVGVIKDYHHNSLYDVIEPLLFYLRMNNHIAHIKLKGRDIPEAIKEVEAAWKNVFPNRPFEYNFLDEQFEEQYANDQRRSQIFSIFSVITIIIACLGLLGLASFTTEQRTKEIGIRKVVGANIGTIVIMISKDFLILIGISIALAIPIAYLFMDKWLQNFAYQTEISYITFVSAALMAILITLATISFHTIKSAISNPVKALREE